MNKIVEIPTYIQIEANSSNTLVNEYLRRRWNRTKLSVTLNFFFQMTSNIE